MLAAIMRDDPVQEVKIPAITGCCCHPTRIFNCRLCCCELSQGYLQLSLELLVYPKRAPVTGPFSALYHVVKDWSDLVDTAEPQRACYYFHHLGLTPQI